MFFFGLSFILFSCEESPSSEGEIRIRPKKHAEPVDLSISTDFNSNKFTSNQEIDLLKELQLCDPKAVNDSDEKHPSCSPNFFRFFKLNAQKELKDGCIILIKAGVNDFPLRRVLIFEREKGQLIKINGFNGNLIEQRPSKSGYNDLIIRFADNIDNTLIYYNCLFQWEKGKYKYKYCEVIDEDVPRNVKAEFRDSMGVEIEKILKKNSMIF